MSLIISPTGGLKGSVSVPASKSFLQRAILCAAFCEKPTVILNYYGSEDVCAATDFIQTLGAKTDISYDRIKIYPIDVNGLNRAKTYVFNIKESGFVLRCALAICSALGVKTRIYSSEGLRTRPNDELIKSLNECGERVEATSYGFEISGKADIKVVTVNSQKSSQYLSALMIAASVARIDADIKLSGTLSSEGYAEITRQVLRDFGISAEKRENVYTVRASEGLISPGDYYAEGDWSSGAALLAFGLLYGDVSVSRLNPGSVQPDAKALSIFKKLGGAVYENDRLCEKKAVFSGDGDKTLLSETANIVSFRAVKSVLTGVNANIDECIDFFPTLAVLCAFAKNDSIISGVSRLKYKESDRLSRIIELLRSAGCRVEYNEKSDSVKISPFEKKFFTFGDCSDHRIVMAAILLATQAGGKTYGENSLKKSFPDFLNIYKLLGGDFSAT